MQQNPDDDDAYLEFERALSDVSSRRRILACSTFQIGAGTGQHKTRRSTVCRGSQTRRFGDKTSKEMIDPRPFADPEAAARKLMEIANAVEPVQDGRIFIELINGPFLFEHKGSPAEYGAGLKLAIERGWLWKHESGTYVKLTQAGADLFA
jgi:hypothetical protein